MSLDTKNDGAKMEELITEVLTAYPDKFAKRRKKHLNVAKNTEELGDEGKPLTECDVKSNIKSVPGVMTIRGCAYAGSKGVVWGPIKDMVHISHGPVGCGQYSWSQRRNYYIGTDRNRHFRHHAVHLRLPGARHCLRRRQEAGKDHRRDQHPLPARQGHHDPVGMSDRPDRRRHRSGVARRRPRNPARPSFRSAAKASAACRSRSATISPMTRCATGCSTTRAARHRPTSPASSPRPMTSTSSATTISAATPGPPASCWRKSACAASATGPATRTLAEIERAAQGQAQSHPLLPVDELHLPPHGREIRHRLDGVQLLRPLADRGVACARSPSISAPRSRPRRKRSSPNTSRWSIP